VGSYDIKVRAIFPDGSFDESLNWSLDVIAPSVTPPVIPPVTPPVTISDPSGIVVGQNQSPPYLKTDPND